MKFESILKFFFISIFTLVFFLYSAEFLKVQAANCSTITVGTSGSQVSSINASSTGAFVGGAFTMICNGSNSKNITSMKVTISGTVTASELANMKVYTDQASSCSTTSFSSGQYGSTVVSPVVGANTFSASQSIDNATPQCFYVVLDTTATVVQGHTLDISIAAAADVTAAVGVSGPPVSVSGTTTLNGKTTLASGTDPSSTTIAPGNGIIDSDAFTFASGTGTDSITAMTITLAGSGTPYQGLGEVRITSDNGSTLYYSAVTSFSSNSVSFSGGTAIPVNSSPVQFKIRITPLSHANMSAPPGGLYNLSPVVSSWTGSNLAHPGTDTMVNTITVDNESPNSATTVSGSGANMSVNLNWTTSNSSDFDTSNGSVILRWTAGSAGNAKPAEGSIYTAGNTIVGGDSQTATVACVISSNASTALSKVDGNGGSSGCTTSNLTNGTTYSYKVFQKDSNGNYDTGVNIGSFTPVLISVSITTTNSFDYGHLPLSGSKSTLQLVPAKTQTAKNDGSGTETFYINSSNATGGTQWILGSTPGSDIFVHEFSINGGSNWTKLTSGNQNLASNVSVNGTQNFDLRISTPTFTSDYQQKSIVVTVLATQ